MKTILFILLSLLCFYLSNLVIRNQIYINEDIGMIYKKFQLVINALFALLCGLFNHSLNSSVFLSIALLNILILLTVIYCSKAFKDNILKINKIFYFICSILCISKFILK